VEQIRFVILILGGGAERVESREWAGGADEFEERVDVSLTFGGGNSPRCGCRGLSMSGAFVPCEKRQRAGALEDARATASPARTPPGFGLRQRSGAFVSPAPTNSSVPVFMPNAQSSLDHISVDGGTLLQMLHFSNLFLLQLLTLKHKHPPPLVK